MELDLEVIKLIVLDDKKGEAFDDVLIKEPLGYMFSNKEKKLIIPKIREECTGFFMNCIDLLYSFFKKPKKEREELYDKLITNIGDVVIFQKIENLQNLQNIDNLMVDSKKKELFLSIINSRKRKTNIKFLYYLETILFQLSFVIVSDDMLKFLLFGHFYSISDKIGYNLDLTFSESAIDLNDEISIELMVDLFNRKSHKDCYILCLIVLIYGKIKDSIANFTLRQILEANINAFTKLIKDFQNDKNILMEKVIVSFNQELEKLNCPEQKTKK